MTKQRQKLEKRVEDQRQWIQNCGGTLEGYRKRYGDPGFPVPIGDGKQTGMSGEGGTAIYNADIRALERLEAALR